MKNSNIEKKNSIKQQFDALAKIAVIGDSSVGKTNILLRYVNPQNHLVLSHIATIGIDFKVKSVEVDGFKLKLQIWDTAGQERFRNLTGTIYQGAEAVLLVYSITDRKTFQNISKWTQDVKTNAPSNIIIALIANKSDLKEERVVQKEQGQKLAKAMGSIFMQTSAKTGQNIISAFEAVCKAIKQKIIKKGILQAPKVQSKTRAKSVISSQKKQKFQKTTDQNIVISTKHQKQKKKGCC